MILKEVEFKSCKRRADRSLTYQFETLREENSEALKEGDELIGTRGVIYFAPQINEAQKNAIDEQLKNEIIEPQRTKSQILRYSKAILFALFCCSSVRRLKPPRYFDGIPFA